MSREQVREIMGRLTSAARAHAAAELGGRTRSVRGSIKREHRERRAEERAEREIQQRERCAERLSVLERAVVDRERRLGGEHPKPWDHAVLRALKFGAPVALPLEVVIPGVPRTKKNNNVRKHINGQSVQLPSRAYREYERGAVPELVVPHRGPIVARCNCAALIYRDVQRTAPGDQNNYTAAIADILEEAGVVANDSLIVAWDGTRFRYDAARPRVEVLLVAVDEDDNPIWPLGSAARRSA